MTAAEPQSLECPEDEACPVSHSQLQAADQLVTSLVRFFRLIVRMKGQFSAGPAGLEHAAFVLLAHLVNDGPQRMTALAESVLSDPSTVSRQTTALVKHGLVERRPDPDDRRASLLAATEEGTRLFQQARHDRDVYIAQALRGWEEPDVRRLGELMERLTADFEAHIQQDAPAAAHQKGNIE